MDAKKNNSGTLLYVLIFISFITLIGSFATHLITGRQAIISMDSLTGSILIGVIFVCFLCWFIYDSKVCDQISFMESFHLNTRHNPAAFCIYAYWFVFILVPALTILF